MRSLFTRKHEHKWSGIELAEKHNPKQNALRQRVVFSDKTWFYLAILNYHELHKGIKGFFIFCDINVTKQKVFQFRDELSRLTEKINSASQFSSKSNSYRR